jgi:hypothetical protein
VCREGGDILSRARSQFSETCRRLDLWTVLEERAAGRYGHYLSGLTRAEMTSDDVLCNLAGAKLPKLPT